MTGSTGRLARPFSADAQHLCILCCRTWMTSAFVCFLVLTGTLKQPVGFRIQPVYPAAPKHFAGCRIDGKVIAAILTRIHGAAAAAAPGAVLAIMTFLLCSGT